jgi:hypothetical protein
MQNTGNEANSGEQMEISRDRRVLMLALLTVGLGHGAHTISSDMVSSGALKN